MRKTHFRKFVLVGAVGVVAVAPCFGEDKKHVEVRQPTPEPQLSYNVAGTATVQTVRFLFDEMNLCGNWPRK